MGWDGGLRGRGIVERSGHGGYEGGVPVEAGVQMALEGESWSVVVNGGWAKEGGGGGGGSRHLGKSCS